MARAIGVPPAVSISVTSLESNPATYSRLPSGLTHHGVGSLAGAMGDPTGFAVAVSTTVTVPSSALAT